VNIFSAIPSKNLRDDIIDDKTQIPDENIADDMFLLKSPSVFYYSKQISLNAKGIFHQRFSIL
jgi:hypothetical protein